MLGTMLALLVFVALESRRMYWAEAAPIVARARAEEACALFARREAEIEAVRRERLTAAVGWGEIGRIGARAAEETVIARRFALEQGCDAAALAPIRRGHRGGPPY